METKTHKFVTYRLGLQDETKKPAFFV